MALTSCEGKSTPISLSRLRPGCGRRLEEFRPLSARHLIIFCTIPNKRYNAAVYLLGNALGAKMNHLPSPHGRSVLIIEDEFLIALDLEATMFKLGFDVCALAPSARKARSLAMNDQPDVALVDVCLEGGREGIEIARWLREVCDVPIVFVTAQDDENTLDRIHQLVPGAPVLSKPVFRHKLADALFAVTKH